jgi:hypothetical protein
MMLALPDVRLAAHLHAKNDRVEKPIGFCKVDRKQRGRPPNEMDLTDIAAPMEEVQSYSSARIIAHSR